MTALRLVHRMKRDWMHTGRRPSGLCGAALLVAARMHEFNRSTDDIIKIVKVCTATLRKRLTEFGETPSSRLTLEEFMSVDLEEEQDPPAFKAARKKARIQQLEEQNKLEDATTEITELQREIERLLEEKNNRLRGIYGKLSVTTDDTSSQEKEADDTTESALKLVEDETIDTITQFINGSESNISVEGVSVNNDGRNGTSEDDSQAFSSSPQHSHIGSSNLGSFNWRSPIRGIGPTAASLGIKDSLQDCLRTDSAPAENENGELDLTGIDDEELDCYIMSADEVKRKSELWHTLNAEYLQELKEKEEREAKEREEGVVKPEKKKRKVRKKNPIQANSAGEAIEMMLQEKRISNKINYDVLKNLNMQFGTPQKPSASQEAAGNSTPKTVSFSLPVSDPLSRLQDLPPTTEKPQNAPKCKREDEITETPEEKQDSQAAVSDVVIETGPVSYEPENKDLEMDPDYDEADYEDEEEDPNSGASYILRQMRGEDAEYEDDGDDYYD